MDIDKIIKIGKLLVHRYHQVNQTIKPHMLITGDDKIKEIIELSFNENTLARVKQDLKTMIVRENLDRYFIIYEASITKLNKKGRLFWKSEQKEKKEMLMVHEFKSDFNNKHICIPIFKAKNSLVFEKKIDQSNWKGSSDWNFYDKEKAMRNALKDAIERIEKKKDMKKINSYITCAP